MALGKLAQEVANAFDNMFGDVMRYGVELSNVNKTTGISTKLMQEMKYKADQLGVSYDSWLGSLKSIQKANADIMMGQGNYAGFQKLGISMNTIRNPAELLAEVMDRVSSLEPAFRRAIMAEVGIAEEAYILYTEKADAMQGSLLLSEKDIANQKALNREWNRLTQSIGGVWNRMLLDNNETLRGAVRYVQNLVDGFIRLKEETGSWVSAIDKAFEKWKQDSYIGKFFNAIFRLGEWGGEKLAELSSTQGATSESDFWKNIGMAETDQDYFERTDSMYKYNSASPVVNYSDNSQTIINTSDGEGQYTEIKDVKNRQLKNQIGNIEFLSMR